MLPVIFKFFAQIMTKMKFNVVHMSPAMRMILMIKNCKTTMKKVLKHITYNTVLHLSIFELMLDILCNDRVEGHPPVVNCDDNGNSVFDDSGFGDESTSMQ